MSGELQMRASIVIATALTHSLVLAAPLLLFSTARVDASFLYGFAMLIALSIGEVHFHKTEAGVLPRLDRALAFVSGVGLLLTAWLSLFASSASSATTATTTTTITWIGAPLIAIGVALRVLAIRELGPMFRSSIAPGPRLITTGIYARLRHPSEMGLLALALGLALLRGSFLAGLVVGIVLLPTSIARIFREDCAIHQTFGMTRPS